MPDTADRRGGRGRRADAQRSIDSIIAAGLRLLGTREGVSIAEIAKEAGVGRVTLYAHFPSRRDLAEAVVERAVAETVAELAAVDTSGLTAAGALERLLRGQFGTLVRTRNLRANVLADLDPAWLRDRHDPVLAYIEDILDRGRESGEFRDDLPASWPPAVVYSLIHTAADEMAAGRLAEDEAVDVLVTTLLSLVGKPDRP